VGARVTAKPIGNPVILTTEEAAGLFPCLTIAFSGSVGVIAVRGDHAALRGRKLALFSSVKCPGDIILKTFDLAQHLRDQGVTVIGGFHSPMEQECLRILLRGKQPVVWCPARSIERMVIWHGLSRFDAGRLRQPRRQDRRARPRGVDVEEAPLHLRQPLQRVSGEDGGGGGSAG